MRETVIRVHRAPRPRPPSPVSLLSRSNTAHLARRVSSHVSPRHERHDGRIPDILLLYIIQYIHRSQPKALSDVQVYRLRVGVHTFHLGIRQRRPCWCPKVKDGDDGTIGNVGIEVYQSSFQTSEPQTPPRSLPSVPGYPASFQKWTFPLM